MNKNLLTTISLCFLLSGCGFLSKGNNQPGLPSQQTQQAVQGEPATPTPVMPPELQGDVEIQQLMLISHTRWHTLHIIYTMNQYPAPGSNLSPEQQNVQVWIQQPAEFKVVISEPKSGPQTNVISDGKNIMDSGGLQQRLPESVLQPFTPPITASDSISPYPLAGYLGTPVSDLIFPTGLAQRGGEYKQTGQELVADRLAYVVEWSREPGKLIDRFWVDEQTGIILRQQNYGKDNYTSPVSDFEATYVEINTLLPAETFSLAAAPTSLPEAQTPGPGAAWVTVKPEVEILNVRSQPYTYTEIITTLKSGQIAQVTGKNEAGDWWQVNVGGKVGWVFAPLVDFTGDATAVTVIPQ